MNYNRVAGGFETYCIPTRQCVNFDLCLKIKKKKVKLYTTMQSAFSSNSRVYKIKPPMTIMMVVYSFKFDWSIVRRWCSNLVNLYFIHLCTAYVFYKIIIMINCRNFWPNAYYILCHRVLTDRSANGFARGIIYYYNNVDKATISHD